MQPVGPQKDVKIRLPFDKSSVKSIQEDRRLEHSNEKDLCKVKDSTNNEK
jgi:hypothetical protein